MPHPDMLAAMGCRLCSLCEPPTGARAACRPRAMQLGARLSASARPGTTAAPPRAARASGSRHTAPPAKHRERVGHMCHRAQAEGPTRTHKGVQRVQRQAAGRQRQATGDSVAARTAGHAGLYGAAASLMPSASRKGRCQGLQVSTAREAARGASGRAARTRQAPGPAQNAASESVR